MPIDIICNNKILLSYHANMYHVISLKIVKETGHPYTNAYNTKLVGERLCYINKQLGRNCQYVQLVLELQKIEMDIQDSPWTCWLTLNPGIDTQTGVL